MKAALDAIAEADDIVVADLAAILSIDTSYPPGQNYPDLVAWAEARLVPLGFTTRRVEVPAALWQVHGAGAHGPRVNLVADRDGPDPIGIYCHMDVVPAGDGWSVPPFAATRQGDWVLGRGAADMKASIAALMLAMEMAHRHAVPLRYTPRILLCTDEEGGAYPGIRYLTEQGHVPTHLLCLDGSAAPRIWSGAFGSLELLLEVHGTAGHSGQHGSGDNALERTIPIMAALMALKPVIESRSSALTDRAGDALHPIFALTVAQAGLKANIIPDLCRLAMNRRYMPEEDDAVVLAEIHDAIAAAAPPGTRWSLHVTGHLAATDAPDQGPHWPRWQAAMAASFGFDPADFHAWGATSSSDMGWVQRARAPGESREILIGGAIRSDSRVHGVDERVRIADIQSLAAAILRYLAGEFA
jgi:succinyl-diaminopimelate desuccinylase